MDCAPQPCTGVKRSPRRRARGSVYCRWSQRSGQANTLVSLCSPPSWVQNPYEVTRFGDPEFSPVFEAIAEHAGRYEIVAILTDDGFGVAIFVPKQHKPVA